MGGEEGVLLRIPYLYYRTLFGHNSKLLKRDCWDFADASLSALPTPWWVRAQRHRSYYRDLPTTLVTVVRAASAAGPIPAVPSSAPASGVASRPAIDRQL